MIESNNYTELFQHLKPTFMGNHLAWLRAARESNLKQFVTTGFPTRHLENWKYTDLSFLAKQQFSWEPRNDEISAKELAPYQLENKETHQLVFIDGYFHPGLSQLQSLPPHVSLTCFNEALLDSSETVKKYLLDEENNNTALVHLNTAFITDGVFIHVPRNTHITQPIHLLFLSSEKAENTLTNIRNIIILEENAEVTILEEHTGKGNFTKNSYTQIILKNNAHLHFHKLQHESKNSTHLARTNISQSKDAQLHHHTISLGAKLARDDLNIALNESGASCELNGFYAPADNQHIDHHTRIDHFAAYTNSDECYKGILQDKSKGVFNGKVIVHPNAQKITSQQMNKNLLLSKSAEMNTKPELEIYADDVRCTHGATVGEIDTDALFFLRSRGLDKNAAMALLIQGFYGDVLEKIKQPDIAAYIQNAVAKNLKT